MKWARAIAVLVLLVMGGLFVHIVMVDTMDRGAGFDTFLRGASDPWQLFINNDLVMGLLFATAWVIYRERHGNVLATIAWVWMILWWGNIVVAIYVLVASVQAEGEPGRFFSGRAAGSLRSVWRPALWMRCVLIAAAGSTLWFLIDRLSVVGSSAVAAIGLFLGFVPVIVSCLLLAVPKLTARRTPTLA